MSNEASNSILKNTSIMTLCTLLSRITGLVRTWAMAFALGNTLLASAYQVAYSMPSMIYDLAMSGVLATGFVPLYLLQKEREGEQGAHRFSSNILSMSLVFLGALTLLSSIFAPAIIETQTFTVQSGEEKSLTTFFFRVFAIQILFYGLGAVITGILNAERTFAAPFLAPVVNNIIVIIVMFGFVPLSHWNTEFAMWWLAIGTSLGVLLQFGIQIPTLVKHGFRFEFHINLRDPMLKESLKVALPTYIYIIGTVVTFSCRNAFAIGAASNGPSTLSYAWMWFQLPYGVIAVSVATAMLTELSECSARKDLYGFRQNLRSGLRSTLFMIIPLATIIFCLATPLIQMFQAGAFSADDTAIVSQVLSFWIISLPFYAGYMFFYRAFGALRELLAFSIADCALRVALVPLYSLLSQPTNLGILGIPIADFVFFAAMFCFSALLLRKKIGAFKMNEILIMAGKVILASAGGAVVMLALTYALSLVLPTSNGLVIISALIQIAVGGIAGLVVIFGLCKLMGIPEFSLLARIGNKLKRLVLRKA